jgi:hypothetical protein
MEEKYDRQFKVDFDAVKLFRTRIDACISQ